MRLTTEDMVKTKLLDLQENVRDFQEYSGKVSDPEVDEMFKDFAEESAVEAKKLEEWLSRHNNKR